MNKKFNYFDFYQALSSWFSRHPALIAVVRFSNRLLVVVMYLAYFGTLLVAAWTHRTTIVTLSQAVAPLVIIPGVGFILLSIGRQRLNAPRPYDEWMIDPLISREKHGNSLPSRHVFSAMVISLVGWHLAWPLGVILLVLTVLLAVLRVIGGVHYTRDVLAGMLCGVICGACLWLF